MSMLFRDEMGPAGKLVEVRLRWGLGVRLVIARPVAILTLCVPGQKVTGLQGGGQTCVPGGSWC